MKEENIITRAEFFFERALYELMQQMPFEKISVTDICEKSMYKRATFYLYYNSKEDLLASLVDGLFEKIFGSIDTDKFDNPKDVFTELLGCMLDLFEKIKSDLKKMVEHNNMDKIRNYFLEYGSGAIRFIFAKLKNKPDFKIPTDMLLDFYVGGIVNMAINYFKNGYDCKKEELVSLCKVIMD